MQTINTKIQQKLESYQELFDSNQRLIYIGQKIDDISERYFNNKNKKELIGDFLKMVEIENSKRKKITAKEKKVKEEEIKKVEEEVKVVVEKIREEKKEKKKIEAQQPNKTNFVLKVGDRVRMIDGLAVGTIDVIEKNKATVNYGFFTSKVDLEQLEMVQRKK